jgi:hypothetical protein
MFNCILVSRLDFDGSAGFDSLPYNVHVTIIQSNASVSPIEKLGEG